MLALLSVGLAVGRLDRRILPPLLPTIIADLSITRFRAGVALSLAAKGFAVSEFPSGRLSDQLTRKTVLFASLAILTVGSVLLDGHRRRRRRCRGWPVLSCRRSALAEDGGRTHPVGVTSDAGRPSVIGRYPVNSVEGRIAETSTVSDMSNVHSNLEFEWVSTDKPTASAVGSFSA
jgi:hypothetical protein